jgi:subtilisin family serine protease
VNGNKPKVKYLNAFTGRVAQHSRVAYYPVGGGKGNTAVAMVIDEILVSPRAANVLKPLFKKRQVVDTKQTVFGGLDFQKSDDPQIWRLKGTLGKQRNPDVAMLVWEARKVLAIAKIPPEQVAPNHVLIPSNYHTCPGGPPEEAGKQDPLPDGDRIVDVVVIDSGYVADGPAMKRIEPLEHGWWFTGTHVPGSGFPGKSKWPYSWHKEPPEPLYFTVYEAIDGKRHLATLVGHANFVAGVIAQACPQAKITVVNHNGGFIEKVDPDTPIPTEASVARSLWEKGGAAAVINVGFAFATLPSQQSRVGPPVPSWSFELALRAIDTTKTVVVAPAGNQNSPIPQYPAAFRLDGKHPNVFGVGSIAPHPKGAPPPPLVRSSFSNYGKWVACCTEGENVLSSFITQWPGPKWPAGPTEDAEPTINPGYAPGSYPDKTFNTGSAHWSGTSFAAPKVAGAFAGLFAQGKSPTDAWTALAGPTGLGMGKILSELPPTP